MPDSFGAYSATTVHEYLDFFARAYGLKGAQRTKTIAEVMEFTSLGPLKDKLTSSLSKGMKQRMCLAKTLLHDPALLILDEATSAVDPLTEQRTQQALRVLLQGRTSFIVAHRLSTIRHADVVLVLDQGQIIERGSPDELIARGGVFAGLWGKSV